MTRPLALTWMETVVCWSWYVVNVWLFFVGTTVFRGISCTEAGGASAHPQLYAHSVWTRVQAERWLHAAAARNSKSSLQS